MSKQSKAHTTAGVGEGLSSSGVHVDTPTQAEWETMWRECDYATFFQSPTWAELWVKVSGGSIESVPERITFPDGRQAILPLCFENKFRGLLSRYVASPQGTFGGWISNHALLIDEVSLLLGHLLDNRRASLVWRMNPYDPVAFAAGRRRGLACKEDQTHALSLSEGPAALLAKFKNGYRSDVKKAMNRGRISIDLATTMSEWQAYYRVYQETLQRWGHKPEEGYHWEIFETLFELRSPHVKLWLGRYDGSIVSGELCFYAKRHVVSWHAATLRDYLRTDVAKVQIFHVIRDACDRGHAWFDFNPSAGLEGVRVFKESFNAQPLPAPMIYVDSTVKRRVRSLAAMFRVPYAELTLTPLDEVLSRAPVSTTIPSQADVQQIKAGSLEG